jgi:hypothetical protein
LGRTTTFAPPSAVRALISIQLTKPGASGALGASFDHLYFGPRVKGDLDGDGRTDLLFHQLDGAGHHEAWLMDGVTRLSSSEITPDLGANSWQVVGIDDFVTDVPGASGDGIDDLVLWNAASGQVAFWGMDATGLKELFSANLVGAAPLPANWHVAATADFNHDGKPDLVWRNFTTQTIQIWTMDVNNHVGTLVPGPDHAVDVNWEIVGALDWNGDGNTDLLWYNPTSGKIVLWFMDASVVRVLGTFTNPSNAGSNNWKVLATGDYGAGPAGLPGTADVVWRNETSGKYVVWHMDRAGNRTAGAFTSPDSPADALNWTIVGPR